MKKKLLAIVAALCMLLPVGLIAAPAPHASAVLSCNTGYVEDLLLGAPGYYLEVQWPGVLVATNSFPNASLFTECSAGYGLYYLSYNTGTGDVYFIPTWNSGLNEYLWASSNNVGYYAKSFLTYNQQHAEENNFYDYQWSSWTAGVQYDWTHHYFIVNYDGVGDPFNGLY